MKYILIALLFLPGCASSRCEQTDCNTDEKIEIFHEKFKHLASN